MKGEPPTYRRRKENHYIGVQRPVLKIMDLNSHVSIRKQCLQCAMCSMKCKPQAKISPLYISCVSTQEPDPNTEPTNLLRSKGDNMTTSHGMQQQAPSTTVLPGLKSAVMEIVTADYFKQNYNFFLFLFYWLMVPSEQSH